MIASLATFATVWVWIMILLSQIAFRRRLSPEEAKALKFKVPGGVATTAVGLVFLVFIIALIGYHPDTRISLYVGFAGLCCCWLAGSGKLAATASWRRHSNASPRLPGLAGALSTIILPNNSCDDESSACGLWQGVPILKREE